MNKKTFFGKRIVTMFLSAIMVFAVAVGIVDFGLAKIRAAALEYDVAKWKTNENEEFSADENGTISVGHHGVYYTENLGDKAKLDKNGALTVTVEFSAKGIPLPTNAAHCVWFIAPQSGNWVDMTGGDVFMPDGSNTLTLGARMYFQNDDQVSNGRILFRCCDYKNYRTADRFYGFNKDNTGKHEISWTITQDGVTMYVDGNALRSDSSNGNQPTYWPEKAAGTRWTLADFLDEEGNPEIYFGMINGSFAETVTIHSIGNGIDYVQAGEYEGEKGSLSVEDDGTYLTDGTAYTVKQYDLNTPVSGSFEVKEVPAYVYDGLDAVELGSVAKTSFSVDVTDALEDGYGFRVNWKPLRSTGVEKTEIEIGYLTKKGFTTYTSYVVPSIAVEKHTFSFSFGDGYAKIVADGISEYISFGQNNDLWELTENINLEAMYLKYSADDKYSDSYTGKWLVKLGSLIKGAQGDWYVSDADVVNVSGEKTAGAVEYDYRMYPTIAENQTIEVNGAAQEVVVNGNAPIKLYSKIALNLEMTLKVSEIPAYDAENACILISFSNVLGGITNMQTAAKAFFVRLAWKDANTLVAYCKMGVETKESVLTVTDDVITIVFGWTDSNSIIKINGETLLKGSIMKGHFGSMSGVQGYFAMNAYNGTADKNAKWAFTLSAPKHVEATMEEPPADEQPTTPPTDETPDTSSNSSMLGVGCGSTMGGTGLALIVLGMSVAFLTKKKED